jgi:signal transduction histidine kinase
VESAFEAAWLDGDLVLLRRLRQGGAGWLQGTWLDWEALQRWLLMQAEGVAPGSSLEPAAEPADPGRRLALLPVRLVPGPRPEPLRPAWTPVRLSLVAAWAAALLGLAGVAVLLVGSARLSQRRASFVSAVTHELRTPLTTFRLYTEMLREGMVSPEDRAAYLSRLKIEADRLGHLVANVLAFSRLERRTGTRRSQAVPIADLVARALPRLSERAAEAGLTLEVQAAPETAAGTVAVDPAAVEQILFNLVDNACKYGRNPDLPVLQLESDLRGRCGVLRLSDHGSGIGPAERRRLFRPFHKSAAHAAGSAPGVGLGLALSRRLARSLGGDLRLAPSDGGATFELTLPRAAAGRRPPLPAS